MDRNLYRVCLKKKMVMYVHSTLSECLPDLQQPQDGVSITVNLET